MRKYTFPIWVVYFYVLFQLVVFGQAKDSLSVEISSVQINSEQADKGMWNSLKLGVGSSLSIGYNPLGARKEQIYYRILLDGVIVEPRLINNYFSLNKLKSGTHVVKIIPFTESGVEGSASVLSFRVEEVKQVIKELEKSHANQVSFITLTNVVTAISILELLIILFLLVRKKSNAKERVARDDAIRELVEFKQTYKRLKEELNSKKDENDHLRNKIKEMDSNLKTLEKANVQLVEQKEKLTSSKNKLEVLQAQKEEMFASAIHDIKNPAAAIRGYIELLNSYDLNAHEQHEIMDSLVASSEDIMKLSQHMCTLIAKAMPEPKLKFAKGSLKTIVDDVYLQNASYAKAKKVRLLNKCTSDLPEVNMDKEKIEEALDNLVNNAIKYAPPETIVEIRTYVKELNKKTVVIEVKDNGVGLSEEDLKRSFQKGAVLSAKPTGLEQSSGLGLWIVKRIIEEHNGKVWVESKEGVGSTFAFELPFE